MFFYKSDYRVNIEHPAPNASLSELAAHFTRAEEQLDLLSAWPESAYKDALIDKLLAIEAKILSCAEVIPSSCERDLLHKLELWLLDSHGSYDPTTLSRAEELTFSAMIDLAKRTNELSLLQKLNPTLLM